MNRREFTGHLVAGAVGGAVLTGTALELEGCNVLDELETWIPVGLSAFDTLISYLNPVAGSALAIIITTVDGLWEAIVAAIANYQHTTDPTQTLLDKIIAAMDALQGGLNTILSALPPGIPVAILDAIKFGFSLLLSTLKSIQNALPTAASAISTKLTLKSVTTNNVASATSAKDFIKQFNANVCVAAGHPARLK